MKDSPIHKIEKVIENILPTSDINFDELDYSVIDENKADWIKLSELTHSVLLVFDCYTNKFVFVSDNIPPLYGIDSNRLILEGHEPIIEIIHPDDIYYGLLVRKKIYSLLKAFSAEEKLKHKVVHEMRVKNTRGEYIRIIEQEHVIELDKQEIFGSCYLLLILMQVMNLKPLKATSLILKQANRYLLTYQTL